MLEKIRGAVTDITSHWKKPAQGKYIPYKEFAAYSVGGIGVNTINSLFGYVALNANCLLIGSALYLPDSLKTEKTDLHIHTGHLSTKRHNNCRRPDYA